jgi:hypothetical protein
LPVLVAFGHPQFSQVRGGQSHLNAHNILYVILLSILSEVLIGFVSTLKKLAGPFNENDGNAAFEDARRSYTSPRLDFHGEVDGSIALRHSS